MPADKPPDLTPDQKATIRGLMGILNGYEPEDWTRRRHKALAVLTVLVAVLILAVTVSVMILKST